MDFSPKDDKNQRVQLPPPNVPDTLKLLKNATLDSARVFFVVAGIRTGVNLLLKMAAAMRQGKTLNTGLLKVILGRDIRRSCFFLSGFTFTWKFFSRFLPRLLGYRTKFTDFISGFLAGAFILAERKDRRISFSHQLAVRAGQSLFASLSSNNIFHIPHAGALLFVLSTSQILYSYALHPTTLPSSFYKFMVQAAQIPHSILEVNRKVVRQEPLDITDLTELMSKLRATENNKRIAANLSKYPLLLPCSILHRDIDSCSLTFLNRFVNVLRMILPVYTGLTFIPALAFRFPYLCSKPQELITKCVIGTIRSSTFLAVLVASYMNIICKARGVFTRTGLPDIKAVYYIAGIFSSSLAIAIEKPSRRVELALYALPKAVDSFYQILYAKHWMFTIPNFEVMLFMLASGTVMLFFRREPENISPLLRIVLKKILRENHKKSNPFPSKDRPDEILRSFTTE